MLEILNVFFYLFKEVLTKVYGSLKESVIDNLSTSVEKILSFFIYLKEFL